MKVVFNIGSLRSRTYTIPLSILFFHNTIHSIDSSPLYTRIIYCSMHVLPRCHKNGVWEHSANVDFHIDYGIVDIPDPSKVTIVTKHIP